MTGAPQPQPSERRDEVADQRRRRSGAPEPEDPLALSEPDREEYEVRLDEYEVLLAGYRDQVASYAAQLDAAHHDGLTGAWLRSAGYSLVEKELQRAGRTDSPLSVAFVDVDGLKARNDTAGHAAGDQALRIVARALLGGLRGYDHVIRWGGDEFLCVLPGATEHEARSRLESARSMMAEDPQALPVSVGIVERHAGEDAEALIARADRELYGARQYRRRG